MAFERFGKEREFSSENGGLDYDRLAEALVKRMGVEGARAVFAMPVVEESHGFLNVSGTQDGTGDIGGRAVKRGGVVGERVALRKAAQSAQVQEVVQKPKADVGSGQLLRAGVVEPSFGVIPESDGSVSGDSVQSFQSVRSSGSVSGGVPAEVSAEVRKSVTFGALSEAYGDVVQKKPETRGYFASTATRDVTKNLAKRVRGLCGAKVPKQAMVELGICTYATGAMPTVVADGAVRLRSLAAIGDATVTQHLVMCVYKRGETVASAQSLRSMKTSNAHLRDMMVKHKLVQYVTYPAGVDPNTATTTATAFEAIVGVMAQHMSVDNVARFLRAVEVVT